MKLKQRCVAFLMAVVLVFGLTPVSAAESMSVADATRRYMNARYVAMILGNMDSLEENSVVGIVNDESAHRELLEEENIKVVFSKYDIVSTEEGDTESEVFLEETLYYFSDWEIKSESIAHTIRVTYDEENVPIVISDSYLEECSGFVSASYVNPYAVVLADVVGSDDCIINIAAAEVGYLEKKSNASLDDKTANAGSNDYTKYGKWYGMNGEPWCAMFVSWCANQANVSTSVIKKTSSCDESMRFFQAAGRFHESIAYGGDYTPKVGDIFFTGPNASDATHTGIVVGVSSTEITAIHGNYSNKVVRNTYSLTDTSLLGFGNPNYESSTHTYAWEYDSTNHWGDCDACGHMISVTAHSLVWKSTVSNHWKTCSACGYSTSTSVHTYVWKTNTASHWKACSSCGFKLDSTAHTWVKKTTYYQCSVCGLKQTNIASTTSLDDIETTNIAMLY